MEISKYCYYGTPFEEMEESEGVSKKPLTIENQIVTDEKGRRRFHGAFTGGFSAGYFNTDLGEHGIAPRLIKTTSFFTEKDVNSESESRSQESRVWDHRELAAETEKLAELLQPVNDSIGFVLLKRMGWRPGKGIGPLVNKQNLEMIADNGEKEKIYGCQLPPGLTKTGTQDENVLLKPDGYKVSVEDIDVHMFNSKTDLHGLGYKGLMAGDILSERRVLKTTQFQQSKSRKGIFGQAFGVGAFEEEDVDIYSVEDLSNYDFSIGLQPSTKDSKTGKEFSSVSGFVVAADFLLTEATEEFVIGTEKLQRKFYPPPKIPRDFKPEHVPLHEENPVTAVAAAATVEGSGKKHVSKKSSRIIEATAAHWDDSSSVFSLLKQSDRERLMKLKAVNEAREQRHKSSTDETSKAASRTIEEEMKPSAPVVDSRMFGADRKKDELYKEFVTYLKRGLLMPVPAGVTEWEWESYKTEFAEHVPENLKENMELTKHGSKPLASNHISKVYEKILHSKFTHGQQDEDDEDERRTAGDEDLIKAVEMKMFGAMTRQKYTWHPDKLLCRRFNVPNPFPDTNFVGIPELRKANKSSMLLDFDSFSSSSRRTEEKEPIITRENRNNPLNLDLHFLLKLYMTSPLVLRLVLRIYRKIWERLKQKS
ncbi:unnamed protein product [Soboliphyme baturini]|uniref:G-patch domain-containing protein n=1 Tax=Soboliphyme baturini TaxID=241478 RepID=A0A183IED6_9BILA|nr:unnamed protein product [Soboliphyme baturini]